MSTSRAAVYLDEKLIEAAASKGALAGRATADVVEDALRLYLGGLKDILNRIRPSEGLSDGDALRLAYEELDKARSLNP